MRSFTLSSYLTTLVTLLAIYQHTIYCQDALNELDKTTAQLARLRGFEAIDHYVQTSDGYILNLVQASTSLTNRSTSNGKSPVLFIHGFLNNANIWLINSLDAQPHDYSSICANATEEELLQLAKSDSGFNSIPITFMNCGREVWLLNRRGNTQSRGFSNPDLQPFDNQLSNFAQTIFGGLPLVGDVLGNLTNVLPTLGVETSILSFFLNSTEEPTSPRYWNFSIDNEAKYDFPEILNYILKLTGQRKLDIVAHSAGGQVTLMAQVLRPELADKIGKTLLYAPAMYLYGSNSVLLQNILPLLVSYVGQSFPKFITETVRELSVALCGVESVGPTLCELALQPILGLSGFDDPGLPGYAKALFDTTSSHESAQLLQTAIKGKTHFFDYLDPVRNFIAYKQPTPPVYDVSKILSRSIAIWSGDTDFLVPAPNILKLVYDMKVPVERHIIGGIDVLWNHYSFFLKTDKIPSLLTIPSLKFLESE